MKLSLSWIFDHIVGSWQNIDIKELVDKFNKITAEIESVKTVTIDLKHFYIIRLTEIKNEVVIGYVDELKKEFKLPSRPDVKLGDTAIIKIYKDYLNWATLVDFWSEKEGYLPPISISPAL